MSIEVTKAVLNSLNEKVYLKNINRVTIGIGDENNNLVPTINENTLDKLNHYSLYLRHNNLKVYFLNVLKLRARQFVVYASPLLLASSCVFAWTRPLNKEYTSNEVCYEREETILDNIRGEHKETGDTYIYSSFFPKKIADENVHFFTRENTSYLKYKVIDGQDMLVAKFSLSREGKLTLNSYSLDHYPLLDEKNKDEYTEIEDKYVYLFDEVANTIKSESNLSDDVTEFLSKMDDNEKINIIIEFVRYNDLENKDIKFIKKALGGRIFTSLLWFVYIFVLINIGKIDMLFELYNSDGVLRRDSVTLGLRNTKLKYDEAFLAAERNRIMNLYNKCLEMKVIEPRKVLSKYENKIIDNRN